VPVLHFPGASTRGRFVVAPCDTPAVEPRHPHAWITVDHVRHPALVLEWVRIADVNGIRTWHARCLYWADGAPAVTLVPQMRVEKG
jgi:hypothetical protein